MSLIAAMFALATTTTPTTPSADDLLARLEAMPVVLAEVAAVVDLNDGVDLEVNFNLISVGAVTIAAHEDDDGSGHGLVLVGAATVAEFELAGDTIVWETVDLTGFRPEQVEAVAASILQVWREDEVAEALAAAPTEPTEDRSLKCTAAAGIAGATAGILIGATCGIFIKNPVTCGKAGGSAYGAVSHYISNKCNGAQNG